MDAVMKKRGAYASRHWSGLRKIHAGALARWLAARTLAHNSPAGLDSLHSSNAISLHACQRMQAKQGGGVCDAIHPTHQSIFLHKQSNCPIYILFITYITHPHVA